MRICLFTPQDLDRDPFPEDDWPCDPRPFYPEAEWHVETLVKETAISRVEACIAQGFDLYFNLCDGAADEPDSPGIEVVHTLEANNVPFAGSNSAFYEPSREEMKVACQREGIATPRHVFVKRESEIKRVMKELNFPMFVKHHSSYASIDLSRRSKVCSENGLLIQVRKILRKHGAALIEEFIEGEEATVLVAENPDDPQQPISYTPVQYRFPKGESFKHSDMKWVEYEEMDAFPVEDPELGAKLRDIAERFFVAMDGASFGRCDIRIDSDGLPWILEINANCGIYYPPADAGGADFCLLNDPAGHRGFTRTLIEAALARHRRRNGLRRIAMIFFLLLGLLDSQPARAEVEVGPRGFDSRHELVTQASPTKACQTLVEEVGSAAESGAGGRP